MQPVALSVASLGRLYYLPVTTAVTVLSIVGASLSFIAALWLLFGFNPESPRYRVIRGGGYTQSDPVGLRQLMVDQGKVAGVAALGALCQLLAVALALVSD